MTFPSIVSRASVRLLVFATLMTAACATMQPTTERNLPPVLAQDEIFRPYIKLGVVEVSCERAGHPNDIMAEANDWAQDALGAEAAKLGADAIIQPEIRVEKGKYFLFPVTDIKAKATAIRFR
ncbi:MAG: hypothetical protein ED859_00270 [Desulfuromonadales bacterium]|nr:MAG: hypothetical protein ED859_00270 [Desulfuromonadales bacterium]